MTTPDNTNPELATPVDPAQKAVSNPATQTLFRFVSMRNPQLAKKEGNLKFIFRKENYTGIFDELLAQWPTSGKSKIDFFTEKVKSQDFDFRYIKRTEHDIASWFGNFYTSSKHLVANGSLPTDEVVGLVSIITNFNEDEQKRKEVFGGLWDSIIYQVLTQEDFYIKELLTQILQTIHYANNYGTFSAESNVKKKLAKQKELSSAKVVIPDYLFVDSAVVPTVQQNQYFTVGSSEVGSNDSIKGANANRFHEQNIKSSAATYLPTESVLKRQKVALASYEKSQLEQLKKELLKTKKLYDKQYSQSYDLALQDYKKLVKPLHDNYNAQLLQVEATFTEEMTAAAKKLALSQVVKPEVPEFQFEFRKERDTAFLQKKLSETSLRSFVNVIGEYASNDSLAGKLTNGDILQENVVEIDDDQFVLPEDENQSFEEMLETIDSKLSKLNDEIYQNTEVEKQEYVSLGGILIPVAENKIEDLYYATVHFRINNQEFGECMEIACATKFTENFSIKSYKISNDNDIVKEDTYSDIFRNGNNQLSFTNFYKNILLLSDFQSATLFSIRCQINGEDYIINVHLSGGEEIQQVPILRVNESSNSFIPKGFGVTRLGIADYLKVEQSTHAYVEGEVAAIENIMAREYREKSTRRLRRSEVTETTSSDTEREQLTDTTTASRFEMQSEIAKMQQEATDIGVNASTGYSGGGFNINVAASYANHRSKEESMRQAVTQAQDVTARALDRVVTKVHQERIEKIVEEFEENNSHGFDNRKGDKHVVGVYRWVDKLMKNQVWDYGKRLMFEFAVPQPAKIHTLATASLKNGKVIEKPLDPRKQEGTYNLKDFSKITDETIKFWSGIYNINLEKLKNLINISLPISFSTSEDYKEDSEFDEAANGKFDLEIPEGYSTTGNARIEVGIVCDDKNDPGVGAYVSVGNIRHEMIFSNSNDFRQKFSKPIYNLNKYEDKIGVSFSSLGFHAGNINVDVECELNNRGKLTIYNMIIEAYDTALTVYNQEIAEEETKAGNIKETNANFYRQIEQDVLKHNCIAYLVDPKVLGTKLYDKENIENFEVIKDKNLDEYASLSKFMEQAFEWNIMSYDFYPYYWGAKTDWQTLYQSESMDPLFRSFLQSGMARVVVTVRPGFEDAVQFYMSTGRLWNGGEVPVIGDPMYLSIVDELKNIKGEAQGKPWITRLPTSLTILQAQNIGLEVQHALPFTTEDPMDFENPEEVMTLSNFKKSDAQMEAEKSKLVENIEINNDYLQLTNNDNPHQVIAQLSLDDLKTALE